MESLVDTQARASVNENVFSKLSFLFQRVVEPFKTQECLVLAMSEYMHAKLLQSCLTLCDPTNCSLLCPRDFLGKNTGVSCHAPPPGDLPSPGTKPITPAAPASPTDSLSLSYWERS